MKRINRFTSFRPFRLFSLLVVGMVAGSMMTASAYHGGKHHRHGQKYGHQHHSRDYDRHYRYERRYDYRGRHYKKWRRNRHYVRDFNIPHVIRGHHARDYQAYYYDRYYHRAHRHHHTIYRFPVFYEDHYVYRPYAYCEGNFFEVGIFTRFGPRFGLSIRF